MGTRKKKVIITGVNREQADEAFATYAKSDAQVQKINADIELQCAKIREKYADKLATLTAENLIHCKPLLPRIRKTSLLKRRASIWLTVPSVFALVLRN